MLEVLVAVSIVLKRASWIHILCSLLLVERVVARIRQFVAGMGLLQLLLATSVHGGVCVNFTFSLHVEYFVRFQLKIDQYLINKIMSKLNLV